MSSSLLQTYADQKANSCPEKQAITDGKLSLTYKELSLQSNMLARCLISAGLERGDHVVLCMTRSPHFVLGMMGVLKADAVYVPIQAETPSQRRQKIMRDCRPKVMVCDSTTIHKILMEGSFSEFPPVLVFLGGDYEVPQEHRNRVIRPQQVNSYSSEFLAYKNDEDDLACLHYTSGSTGDPKGVMISHRNIDEYVAWAVDCIDISDHDRILGTAPFHFDMSLFDVYCSLRAGATLCIANEKLLLFPQLLVGFAEAENITIWKGVSSLLMYLARTGAVSWGRLPTLQKILFSGEVFHTKYLIQWMSMFPGKSFYNAYGPTEATGISMYYHVECMPLSADERIPLGKPCENTEVFLLDDNKKPVQPGEPGEIYIKGVCVTKGYLNDPEKTRTAFSDDSSNPMRKERIYKTGDYARLRPDGNYEFLGRRDNQVKYMGYRIDLSDIEQSLVSTPGVRDAGVILAESSAGNLIELVAYIEIDEGVSLFEIIPWLKDKLPPYMIPKQIHAIKRVPKANSGKIDRQALSAYHKEKSSKP